MREGFVDPVWQAAFRYPHESDVVGSIDFPCDELSASLDDVHASTNPSSDEQDACRSPLSSGGSGGSSPMFRDIDWSCHTPDRSRHRVSPQLLMWGGRLSPPVMDRAPEQAERGVVVDLGLYGELEYDNHALALGLETEGDAHPAKRARKARGDEEEESERRDSITDDDGPTGQKRTVLNILERARREGLKSNFHRLRDNVPELTGNKRVPKGLILKKAADYIRELSEESRALECGLQALRRENERLMQWRAAAAAESLRSSLGLFD